MNETDYVEQREIPDKPYYVTMTDKFMSGWGRAKGKINKFVIGCDTLKQAETIERNAHDRDEMIYVNICYNKPRYNRRYLVSYKDYSQLGTVWTK